MQLNWGQRTGNSTEQKWVQNMNSICHMEKCLDNLIFKNVNKGSVPFSPVAKTPMPHIRYLHLMPSSVSCLKLPAHLYPESQWWWLLSTMWGVWISIMAPNSGPPLPQLWYGYLESELVDRSSFSLSPLVGLSVVLKEKQKWGEKNKETHP